MEERPGASRGHAPPRVFVLLVVGQRGVLDQGEEEGGLRVRVGETGLGSMGPQPSWASGAPPPASIHRLLKIHTPGEVFPRCLLCLCRLPAPWACLYAWLALRWDLGAQLGAPGAQGGASIPWPVISTVGVQGRCGPRKSQSQWCLGAQAQTPSQAVSLSPNPRPPSGSSELLNLRLTA